VSRFIPATIPHLCDVPMNLALGSPTVVEAAPWVVRLARVGYTAKGILYIIIGLLAARAALGRGGRTTDAEGALRVVHGASFGRVILLIIAVGLVGYALWRVLEAAIDAERRGSSVKAILVRLGHAIRGVLYGLLGLSAFRLATSGRSGRSAEDPRRWTAEAFGIPAGEVLVWVAAGGVTAYGLYQFYKAWAPKLSRQLDLSSLPFNVHRWVVGVSRFGIGARGVVFCLIGFFLARAALQHDPSEAGGMRESLRMVAGLGRWPFVVVALGLVAYGLYELVNARYRRIRAA
jgi:hypothetical protein